MSEFEKRDEVIFVLVTKTEKRKILEKMHSMDIRSISAYARKMLLNGYCINLDTTDIRETVSLLRRCSNNLNQYAKKANENGSIYRADIRELQKSLDEIWEKMKELIVIYSSI